MGYYKKHIFFCINQKIPPKQCCGNHNAADMVSYAKEKLVALGIDKEARIRISSSGCMGRCSLGPAIVVYPEGVWYRYSSQSDIDQILAAILKDEISYAHQIPDPAE